MSHPPRDGAPSRCPGTELEAQVSRRAFLFGAGASLVWLSLPACSQGRFPALRQQAQMASYPRQPVGRLSQLAVGAPVPFTYPFDHPSAQNFLMRLGRPAAGGVGPEGDVVAFNAWCTHQGGPLGGLFKADPGVAGPCPLHWTLFDLTRHGMVVSGHATLGLPQILLETEDDAIVATGVMGLVYGHHDNRAALARS